MNWHWFKEGFRNKPKAIRAPLGLRLYRVWGGSSKKLGSASRPGVCFSTQKPTTRMEAESLFSAWE